MRAIPAALLLSATLAGGASTATGAPDGAAAIPVKVTVTAEPAELREKASALLKKQLTGIPGVSFAETGPSATLDVIVAEFKMSDGRLAGYMIYAAGYQPGPSCGFDSKKVVNVNPVVIQWQSLRMAPPDLEAAAQRTVAAFKEEVIDSLSHERNRLEGKHGRLVPAQPIRDRAVAALRAESSRPE